MRVLTIVLAMSLCLSGGLGPRPVRAERMNPITAIEMTAEKYEYKPAEIRVKAGARVQLYLRAPEAELVENDRDCAVFHGVPSSVSSAG